MNSSYAAEKNKRYVLVMDANIDDRFHTCMLLQQFNCNIFTAHTAEEAIEFMTVAPPSAVVADAGQNGLILLSWITKDPRFLDVPLILLSSVPDLTLEGRARKGEFAACLRKPLNVEEFYRIVQLVIEKGPRRNIRIATYLSAKLGDEVGGKGYVTVLSEHGMFFRTLEPRPVNTRIPIILEIKGGMINLEAVVLYTTTFDEGPFREPGMGMRFVTISRADRDIIKTFILEWINEGMSRQDSGK